jgi:hypothetical protein
LIFSCLAVAHSYFDILLEALLEDHSSVAEASPLKKRRAPISHEIENLPSPSPSPSLASSNILFEDQPLVEIETPSTAPPTQHPPQPNLPSRSIVDSNGWVTIDKSHTGNNCIVVLENNHSMAPPTSIPRRTTIHFDDPNPSSSSSRHHHLTSSSAAAAAEREFPQAVVIEMRFRMKNSSNDSSSNSISRPPTTGHGHHPRDQRRFKKNIVRAILNGETSTHRSASSSSSVAAPVNTFILKKRDMDKVLPKESEREILVPTPSSYPLILSSVLTIPHTLSLSLSLCS